MSSEPISAKLPDGGVVKTSKSHPGSRGGNRGPVVATVLETQEVHRAATMGMGRNCRITKGPFPNVTYPRCLPEAPWVYKGRSPPVAQPIHRHRCDDDRADQDLLHVVRYAHQG